MQQKWLILASVACGTFMATLDASIVNVALPSITASFHTGLSHSRWVVIAYLFSITGLLLFFGKLADVIGRKIVFNTGFLIFTLGCLFCALSESMGQLIFSRGLQGFGAAMVMANGPAIITAAFPQNERGKALGTLAMVVSAGLAAGPSIGGVLVRYFNWPSIFYVNIPFALIGAFLVYKFVPPSLGMSIALTESETFEREQRLPWWVRIQIYSDKLRYFDWMGTFMWMFIQLGYSLAIDRENVLGLAGPLQRLISFGSVGLLILFLVWEWSVKEPVLDLSLFRSRLFLTANLSGLINFIVISAVTLLMPFYLQNVRGLPPDQVGLIMTAIPLTIFFVAPIAGRLSDKYGSRFLSTFGMFMICTAMTLFSLPWRGFTTGETPFLALYLVLVGCGIGLFQSPNNNAIMGAVAKNHLGVASAMLATIRNFGLVTGAALGTTSLMYFYQRQNALQHALALPSSPAQNFIFSMRYTFMILAVVSGLGILVSLTRGEKKHESKN